MGRLLGKQHIRDLCLALGLLCAALALVCLLYTSDAADD